LSDGLPTGRYYLPFPVLSAMQTKTRALAFTEGQCGIPQHHDPRGGQDVAPHTYGRAIIA
jgi:hypothetical protein